MGDQSGPSLHHMGHIQFRVQAAAAAAAFIITPGNPPSSRDGVLKAPPPPFNCKSTREGATWRDPGPAVYPNNHSAALVKDEVRLVYRCNVIMKKKQDKKKCSLCLKS